MESCCKDKSAGKHAEKHVKKETNTMQVVLIVLAIGLVLFVGFQTLQIDNIEEQLTGKVAQAPRSAPGVRSTAPSSPVMVGGC